MLNTPAQPTAQTPTSAWIPKEGDYVTTESYLAAGTRLQRQIKGKIKIIRPDTPTQLPILVNGFWFEPHQLTHRPDLDPDLYPDLEKTA